MTIRQKILEYLKTHKDITPVECWNLFHSYKLATEIGKLIREGHDIGKERVDYIKADGTPSHYTRYWLIGKGEQNNA